MATMDLDEGRRVSGLVGGFLLLAVGAALTLRNLGALRIGRLWDFWPMLLVWVGLTRMIARRRPEQVIWGAVLVLLGVFFQMERLDWVHASIGDFWPLLLVAAGVAMIAEGMQARRASAGPAAASSVPEVKP